MKPPAPQPPTALFTSLPRRDQRTKAELYLKGLLTTPGRKSVRNISTTLHGTGNSATEQSLHHFITSSTWDWMPVREALADTLTTHTPHHIWTIRPLSIPKAGTHTVGVDRLYIPHLGHTVHGQLAFGLWHTTPHHTTPVDWRLYLPDTWLNNPHRRTTADIPTNAIPEDLDTCATTLALHLTQRTPTPHPLVLDHIPTHPHTLTQTLTHAGIPFLTRITPHTPLTHADPTLPGARTGTHPATQLLHPHRTLRHPTHPHHPTPLIATIPVHTPHTTHPHTPLLLFAEWNNPHHPPTNLWLTTLHTTSPTTLHHITQLATQTHHHTDTTHTGLHDFEGRTYPGWHRHMTLASIAHATTNTLNTTNTTTTNTPGPGRSGHNTRPTPTRPSTKPSNPRPSKPTRTFS